MPAAKLHSLVLDRNRIAAWFSGAAIFVLFCTPSIKFYLYTEAINLVPIVLVAASLVLRPPVRMSYSKAGVFLLVMALFATLFAAGVYNSASLELVSLI